MEKYHSPTKMYFMKRFFPSGNVNPMKPTSILSEAGCWLRTSWSLSCLSLFSSFSLTSSWLMRICEQKDQTLYRESQLGFCYTALCRGGGTCRSVFWEWVMLRTHITLSSRMTAFRLERGWGETSDMAWLRPLRELTTWPLIHIEQP